ncbi:FAD-dependent urate hydroxylase [compost metagenome]
MFKDFEIENGTGSAIIVGASLSGLMTAIALAETGMNVTVVEKTGSKPRNGAALQVDSGETDYTLTAQYLRKLASDGKKSVEAWSSVQLRLREAAMGNPKIKLRYSTMITSIGEDGHCAWIEIEKGEILRAEILIGADGYRSKVRKHVSNGNCNSVFTGYMIWVAILEEKDIAEQYRPGLHTTFDMPNGIGDFLLGSVIAGADGSKAAGERRLSWAWYDNTRNDLLRETGCVEGNMVKHSLNAPDIPERTLTELAMQASVRWPQPWLAATLHSINSRNLTGIPVTEYVPDALVKGRVVLVGDAAHVITPLTAMGFNASLEDAATLADCISKERNLDKAAALLQYESKRLKVVQNLVKSGQSFSRSFGR